MLSIVFAAAAVTASPSALPEYGIDAPHVNVWNGVIYAPTLETISADKEHRRRLLALHKEGLAQQTQDGGTLTPEHRDALQRKLDRIQLRFAEARRRADIDSVDVNGSPRYSAATRPAVVLPPGLRVGTAYR